MKTVLVSALIILILASSTCRKEEGNCHYDITIKNTSKENVFFAVLVTGFGEPLPPPNAEIKCRLDGQLLRSGESYQYRPYNSCIENRMSDGEKIGLFLVDSSLYNDSGVLYSCDSVEIKNKILRHDVLNLNDLRSIDFTITYP